MTGEEMLQKALQQCPVDALATTDQEQRMLSWLLDYSFEGGTSVRDRLAIADRVLAHPVPRDPDIYDTSHEAGTLHGESELLAHFRGDRS